MSIEPLITHRSPWRRVRTPTRRSWIPLLTAWLCCCNTRLKTRLPLPRNLPRAVRLQYRAARREGQIGVALIGAGNLARWAHLPNIQKLPTVSLRAIHSNSGVRGKGYGTRFGSAYCTTDYRQILTDPEVDVVFITSRNQHHGPQAAEALRAGKHVFVEKPMAITEEECRDIGSRRGGERLPFNSRVQSSLRSVLYAAESEIGETHFAAVIGCRINSPGISGAYWMADPAVGGAILGEACHFVDLMYWLLDSEPLSVSPYCCRRASKIQLVRTIWSLVPFCGRLDWDSELLHDWKQDLGWRESRSLHARPGPVDGRL